LFFHACIVPDCQRRVETLPSTMKKTQPCKKTLVAIWGILLVNLLLTAYLFVLASNTTTILDSLLSLAKSQSVVEDAQSDLDEDQTRAINDLYDTVNAIK